MMIKAILGKYEYCIPHTYMRPVCVVCFVHICLCMCVCTLCVFIVYCVLCVCNVCFTCYIMYVICACEGWQCA